MILEVKKNNIGKLSKKLIICVFMFIFNILVIMNSCMAVNANITYDLQSKGKPEVLLKYKGEEILSYYTCYSGKSFNYPAYCLDSSKQGAEGFIKFRVTAKDEIHDVTLWRYIINGYPYKQPKDLNCETRNEAYVATQHAIYCYIEGRDINDYEAVGEGSKRTLQAMIKIIEDANATQEKPTSSAISINKISDEFKIDNLDKTYVSKTYEVNVSLAISKYTVKVEDKDGKMLTELKITDINNNEKTEFESGEKFKILLPVKNMKQNENFNIIVEAKILAKPIIYAIPDSDIYQDYAIPETITEKIVYEKEDEPYPENKTNIKIIKQDQETNERIEGVEFEILDKNKNVVYSNLKTDKNGEINLNNIVPGTYYLKEVKAKDGYIQNKDLIEFQVQLNDEIEIFVNNLKEDEPIIKVNKKEIQVQNKVENEEQKEIVKKLPVTGM